MRRLTYLSLFLVFVLLACNISSTPAGGGADQTDTPPDQTISATWTLESTQTPQPSLTYTSTTAAVTVTVTVDTNCRTGPGQVYDNVGGLMKGETAVVVGKDASGKYWIIQNPDVPGGTCWIWGTYAKVTGDISTLPVIAPPPTPTPKPTATPVENAPDPLPADHTGIVMNIGQCFNFDTGQVTTPDAQCDLYLASHVVFQNRNGAKISGYTTFTAPTRSHCLSAKYEPGDLAVQTDLYMCEITSQGQPGFIVVRAYLGSIPFTGIVFDYWVFH
jgi:hypothetical protein